MFESPLFEDNSFNASIQHNFNDLIDPLQGNYTDLSSQQLMNLAGETLIDAWQNQANINQALIYGFASIFKSDFTTNAEIVFGKSFDIQKAQKLGDEILGGEYSVLPNIEFHSKAEMKGASGAYSESTNSILINSDFLINNADNPTIVGKALVEEEVHFIDDYASSVDSPGDEGEISAGLVAGETYTAEELQRLKVEDDSTTLVIDGQELKVEQSSGNEPYNNFGDPDEIITSWEASFFHFNGQGNPNFDNANKIGTVNLGSNVRDDGQWGMNLQNWGSGSPAPDVPDDLFAMQAYTRRNLIAGHKYEVWVRSDDGYQVLAHKLDGEPFDITENALNGEWQPGAYGDPVKHEFVAPETGTFDFKINMFETYGDAYVDLVLKDVTATSVLKNFFSDVNNTNGEDWSQKTVTEMWDRVSGESAQFDDGNFTDGDRWKVDMPPEIASIYQDLSNTIFGSVKAVNSGYAYDQSYYNGFGKWHAGLDIQASKGTSVNSAVSGTATLIGDTSGNYFIGVKGDDGKLWIYGHLSNYSVTIGERVDVGQLIGSTNNQNHLHLEVQNNHSYAPTLGANSDQNFILNNTISPLQAYWEWSNR